jgi:hypothetical protein
VTDQDVNWDSVRQIGQRTSVHILLGISPEEARWLQGARVQPKQTGHEPFMTEEEGPLRVVLAPDLAVDDPDTRLLAQLDSTSAVEVIAAPESPLLAVPDLHIRSWSLHSHDSHLIAEWHHDDSAHQTALSWAGNWAEDDIARNLGPLVPGTREDRIAYFRAIQFHRRHSPQPSHIFVTRVPAIIAARTGSHFPNALGQCTPSEALMIAGLVLRHRNDFAVEVSRGYPASVDKFSWYAGVAELLMPSYLPYLRHLTKECEAAGTVTNGALDYHEGILIRTKHVLAAHDALGWLHLVEGEKGSDNVTLGDQTLWLYSGFQAAIGALEGLARLVGERAGAMRSTGERRELTFATLLNRTGKWSGRLASHTNVIDAARAAYTPVLQLAAGLRGGGFHESPLIGQTLAFGHGTNVFDADGRARPNWIEDLTLGSIHPARFEGDLKWVTHGVDGMIALRSRRVPYLLPFPTIRAVLRDVANLLDQSFAALATNDGVAIEAPFTCLPATATDLPINSLGLRADSGDPKAGRGVIGHGVSSSGAKSAS